MKKTRQLAIYAALVTVLIAATSEAQAPKPNSRTLAATGILERLAERSGIYGVPATAKVPGFIADAGWPQKLPNNWIIGQIGGITVDWQGHIWVIQRPRSLTEDEKGATLESHEAVAAGNLNRVKQLVEADPGLAKSYSPDGFPVWRSGRRRRPSGARPRGWRVPAWVCGPSARSAQLPPARAAPGW